MWEITRFNTMPISLNPLICISTQMYLDVVTEILITVIADCFQNGIIGSEFPKALGNNVLSICIF